MKLPTSILLPFALAVSILPGPRGLTPATEVLTASGRLVDDASITGRILDDHGQPVMGLTVAALQKGSDGVPADVPGSRASIDEHGNYHVTGLQPGKFIVRASFGFGYSNWSLPIPGIVPDARPLRRDPPGGLGGGRFITDADGTFVEFGLVGPRRAGQLLAYIPSYFGGATKASAATQVEVAAAETKPNIDVTIHTQPAVMIHGAVTGPDGPIDDATLQLANDNWDAFTISAASGPAGRYEFVAVPRGVYTLTARRTTPPRATVLSAEGYPQLFQYDASRSGAPMTMSVNATVNATGAAEMNVNVRMQGIVAMPWSPSGRRPEPPAARKAGAGTLDGIVRNDRGEIVPQVWVAIYSPSLGGPRAVVADENGRFHFGALPPSEFTLLAAAPFSATIEYEQPRAGAPGKKIVLADGEHRQIDEVRIARPGAISGAIIDAAGRSISNARVIASTDGDTLNGYAVEADNGHYRIAGLAPGEYVVAIGYTNATYAPGTTQLSEARRVLVAAGEEVRDVDIRSGVPRHILDFRRVSPQRAK